ncbi:mannosyltransferase family protein [Pyxidicoccus xibeiensis]|uniref:mannosyltransferase family protein n=1 Tax=Pyxidicoccus xibeiensis TaxID=2906759 RepID=UPI0020A81126|nr:mannosyltransferase family protein [Pyxidicoccus xibeiensis]MCP3137918.1 hypothetical protein [Pyxidicoccus xibeiensis]
MNRLRWAAFPLAVFVFTRVALLAFTSVSLRVDPRLHFEGPALLDVPSLGGLCRWDCLYYANIALHGYRELFWTNFFPLFPLLGKGLALLTGLSMPHALVVVANLAGLGALVAVYRVFLELDGEEVARSALLLFAAFPFAFFQAAGYPESLMVLTSAGAMLLALRGRHVAAGAVLGLGVLARHLTIVAGLSLLAAQVRERGAAPRRFLSSLAVLGLALPFVFVGLYMLYLGQTRGEPLAWWTHREEGWGKFAWAGLGDLGRGGALPLEVHLYVLFSLVPGVGAVLLLRQARWRVLAPFALGLMLTIWTVGLAGLGRYAASCWPAFLPLGAWAARRPGVLMPAVLAGALLQGLFLYLYAHWYNIN